MEDVDFNTIWESVIAFRCRKLREIYGNIVFDNDSAKKEVQQFYEETRDYAKRHYMEKHEDLQNHLLNRNKIAAAFMIAILKARPLKKGAVEYYDKRTESKFTFNEQVALYSGLQIVRAFILLEAKEPDPKWSAEQKKEAQQLGALFEKSIPLDDVPRQRWLLELYYLRQEGCYNLLALAHEIEDFVTIALQQEKMRISET